MNDAAGFPMVNRLYPVTSVAARAFSENQGRLSFSATSEIGFSWANY
jgi:hypothetical protein